MNINILHSDSFFSFEPRISRSFYSVLVHKTFATSHTGGALVIPEVFQQKKNQQPIKHLKHLRVSPFFAYSLSENVGLEDMFLDYILIFLKSDEHKGLRKCSCRKPLVCSHPALSESWNTWEKEGDRRPGDAHRFPFRFRKSLNAASPGKNRRKGCLYTTQKKKVKELCFLEFPQSPGKVSTYLVKWKGLSGPTSWQ